MRKVLVTGSISFDHIMNLPSRFSDYIMPDKIHILNVSFYTDEMRKERGGTAGNIAYTLALLGLRPLLLSSAGEDFDEYGDYLTNVGVDCTEVKVIKGKLCATGFCITDMDDNQIWGFSGGALIDNKKLSLMRFKGRKFFVVVGPNDVTATNHFVRECKALGYFYLFDPAFNIPRFSPRQLRAGIDGSDILVGNDYEIDLLKSRTGLTNVELLENGRILITTLGAKGSRIQQDKKSWNIPAAKPKKVVDPTGAGDAFTAALIYGLARELPLEATGQLANWFAAQVVRGIGARSFPTKSRIDHFLRRLNAKSISKKNVVKFL